VTRVPGPTEATHDREASGRDAVLALATHALTLLWLFWPLARDAVLGATRFFEWDVPEQYWPDLVRLCGALHGGEGVPYWSPHDRGGYAYYADPQAAPYHPVHWAICGLAGPSPSIHWATARVVLGFAVSLLGGHLWLRHTPVGRAPGAAARGHAVSALGACVLGTAPFLRHNWELNLTFAIAWLPWMLLALDALLARPGVARAAWLALAIALCAWSGSPPALWLASTFVIAYGAARLAARARDPQTSLRALILPAAVSIALAAMLCAVVLVPGQLLSGRSVQADHTFASIAAESLAPARLVALVAPQAGNHLFLGPVVWLGAGLALATRRARVAALACLALATIAVLLTMGEHGPLFRAFFDHVPGFDRFRLPHRYEAWLGPTGALVTVLGIETVPEHRVSSRRAPALVASRTHARAIVPLALAVTHLALVTLRLDPERHSRAGAFPCRGADDALARAIATSPDRVFDEFALGCRSGTRLGHRDLRGYQDPLMLHAYERVLSRLAEHPSLLTQYGVRHVLSSPHFLHGWDHHYLPRPETLAGLPGARIVHEDGERRLVDLGPPIPRAYFVPDDAIEEVPSREEALTRVVALAPAPIAVVETERTHLPRQRMASVDAIPIDAPSDDTLTLHLRAPTAGIVVVNDTWDEGWTAEIDGAPADVLRVNALVRGVRVPAGTHGLVLRFAPWDGRATRVLWALGLLLVMLAIALEARPRAARTPRAT
jgi:hypothetical protein